MLVLGDRNDTLLDEFEKREKAHNDVYFFLLPCLSKLLEAHAKRALDANRKILNCLLEAHDFFNGRLRQLLFTFRKTLNNRVHCLFENLEREECRRCKDRLDGHVPSRVKPFAAFDEFIHLHRKLLDFLVDAQAFLKVFDASFFLIGERKSRKKRFGFDKEKRGGNQYKMSAFRDGKRSEGLHIGNKVISNLRESEVI